MTKSPLAQALDQFQSQVGDSLCTWPGRPTVFTRANANDQWPRPITPLTQDLIALPQERGLEEAFSSTLGITRPAPDWTWNGVFYGWMTYGVEPAAAMADNLPGWSAAGVYGDFFGVSVDPEAPAPESAKTSPFALIGVLVRFTRALRGYRRQSDLMRDEAQAQLRADLGRDWSDVSTRYLAQRVAGHPALHQRQRVPHVLGSVISSSFFDMCVSTVGKFADDPAGLVADAVSGLGGIHLAEATQAMHEVAHGRLSREELVARYGFRGANEFELSAHPWGDDESTLDRLIQAAGRRPGESSRTTREAARARLQTLAGRRWPLLRWQLAQLEGHMRYRENGKIPMAMSTHSLRLTVREAGRRLVAGGRIKEADDVHFLTAAELLAELSEEAVEDRGETIAARRRTHELANAFILPEILDARPGRLELVSRDRWRQLGVLPPAEVDTHCAVLNGVGASAGSATGRARVVHDPNEVEIEDGDILVAAGTDSAWTPLFLQASAVVVDVGGIMSHSSIAAREVGIPCVVNVKVGTTLIHEGQAIAVDGNAGTVTLQ